MSTPDSKEVLIRLIDDLKLDSSFASIIASGIREATEEEAATMASQLRGALDRMPGLLEAMRRSLPKELAQTGQLVGPSQMTAAEAVVGGNRKVAATRPGLVIARERATDIVFAVSTAISSLLDRFSLDTRVRDLAIDFGTATTLIYVRGRGVVLNEPSVAAVRYGGVSGGERTIQAVGSAVTAMLGKMPGNIEAIRPMKDGVITDFTVADQMLKHFIKKVNPPRLFSANPRIMICVPYGSTQVERHAIRESALDAGASHVYLIEEPMAAAIGAGLPVSEATGSMVVDIGGGTTEVGVISLGGMVYSNSVRVGGDKFDEAIINYIRRNYGMLIGEVTAELIKKEIGSAFPGSEVREMEVKGRNLAEGIPRSFTISSNEILEALTDPLNSIVSAVKSALEHTLPELGADIAEKGMVLTGGGALLRDLDRLLMRETGLPVSVAEDPLTCVVRGSAMALERMESLTSVFASE